MGKHETSTGDNAWRSAAPRCAPLGSAPAKSGSTTCAIRVVAEIEREVASINRSEDEACVMAWTEASNAELVDSLPDCDWGEAGSPA